VGLRPLASHNNDSLVLSSSCGGPVQTAEAATQVPSSPHRTVRCVPNMLKKLTNEGKGEGEGAGEGKGEGKT
jgi:hypothetical protein